MGKLKKRLKIEEEEEELTPLDPPIKLSSDDDEEANEDLSLKIVQKAMLRASGNITESQPAEVVTEVKKKKVKKVRKKVKRIKAEDDCVVIEKEADKTVEWKSLETDKLAESMLDECQSLQTDKLEEPILDECKSLETDKLSEPEVDIADNVVLRKLLRGPRYFDPPDNSWGTCYNCGEVGHIAVKCTSAKRVKPCSVCGSLEHNRKQCTKGKDCYICNKGGHRAKDCPEKKSAGPPQSSKVCLKCGESGHEMFTCQNDYSPDDLKEIQCYICKSFGHLCCANYTGAAAGQVSCYRCGQTGHIGLACTRLRGESYGTSSPSSCYKCGEGGHFARECTSSVKTPKRNRELSTPKSKSSRQGGGFSASSKSKHSNGWTENSGEFSWTKKKQYSRNSHLRPTSKNKFYNSAGVDGYASTPHSYGNTHKYRFDYSGSNDTEFYPSMDMTSDYSVSRNSRFYERSMHSASKFQNSSTGRMRNYYN